MLYFLSKRIVQGLFVVLGVSFAIFLIMRVIPGDPVRLMLSGNSPESAIEEMRKELGLDRPLLVQYGKFLMQVAQGDLGTSFFRGASGASSLGANAGNASEGKAAVLDLILERLPLTLSLTGMSLLFAIVIAFPLGFWAGVRPKSWADRFVMAVSVVLQSIPNFWLGIMLILLVTVKLGWIPSMGYNGPTYLILPSFALAVSMVPVLMRTIRSSVSDVLQQNFIKVARARGISESKILFKHVLKNCSIPVITLLGVQIGYLLGGALVIEFIFDFPGIGLLTIYSVTQRDFPVIQGIVIFFSTIFVLINILVDALYAYIDPRIR